MLTFKYGVMGSSKSAQALMTKFDYEQKGLRVLLIKPSIDNRSGINIVASRIGLSQECYSFSSTEQITNYFVSEFKKKKIDLVIVDEAQFLTKNQVEELKRISKYSDVICFGLKTNFMGELFEGSKRLIELAEHLEEISGICRCGERAIINAKLVNGQVVNEGQEIDIGGDEKYEAMCYDCWIKATNKNQEEELKF